MADPAQIAMRKAESCHRNIKRIAVRKPCTVAEAIYRYNATPKDDVSVARATVNAIHSYRVRIKGIDGVSPPSRREMRSPYRIVDPIWVKLSNSLQKGMSHWCRQ